MKPTWRHDIGVRCIKYHEFKCYKVYNAFRWNIAIKLDEIGVPHEIIQGSGCFGVLGGDFSYKYFFNENEKKSWHKHKKLFM